MSKIKVIGTVGPSSIDSQTLKRLKNEGLNSFRINLSHSTKDSLHEYYIQLKSVGIPPSLDTQGAQVRITNLKRKSFDKLGEKITIAHHSKNLNCENSKFDISVNQKQFFEQIEVGDEIKIGFEGLIVRIAEYSDQSDEVIADVIHTGNIDTNKALDITNKSINLETFTEFDIECISESMNHDVKEIYISFCNTPDAIKEIKEILLRNRCRQEQMPSIIAKIESRKGLLNLHEIAKEADGILVDRGDLSRELRISMIPGIINNIIRLCKDYNTPCYIATNVLDSMMTDPLPSRAEISDLYNLLESGVSGFVLAAEMAIGKNPVESLQVIQHMIQVYYHQKNNTGIIPYPHESIFNIQEPLKSWL